MPGDNETRVPENQSFPDTTLTPRNVTKRFMGHFTAGELRDSLMPAYEMCSPLEQLIGTGEAAFEFIRISEMDLSLKNAFGQLERQFNFYKNLLSQ